MIVYADSASLAGISERRSRPLAFREPIPANVPMFVHVQLFSFESMCNQNAQTETHVVYSAAVFVI